MRISIRSEINKNVKVDLALLGDLRDTLEQLLPHVEPAIDHSEWNEHIDEMRDDSAMRDILNLPDNGHLYAAHVINDLWRCTGGNAICGHRCGPEPDVGSPILQTG